MCGWIYDEKIGDPDSGIAAGTRFEDIPDDWLCPECGVGKDDFELIDMPESSVPTATDLAHISATESQHKEAILDSIKPIVIVGTGLAGYGLLKELRKIDCSSPIILITSDDGRSYSKPALSTGYTKRTSADELAQYDAGSMAALYSASVWTMTKVTAINTAHQQIKLSNGFASINYSKLVLALGADCIEPPLKGDALDDVHTINDLMDFAQFQSHMQLKHAKKICVIGAGLIGCEYSNDLLNGGFEVDVVDPLAHCLPTLLPAQAGGALGTALAKKGAKFHFGKLVTQVNRIKQGGALEITLDDNSSIEADVVLSAIGVRPQTKLAEESGIKVERGICTNSLLETSAENVYALGDCAEVEGHVLIYIAPMLACIKALAKTLNGEPTEVHYPAMPVTVKTPACPVVICPPPRTAEGDWVIVQHNEQNVQAEFRSNHDALLGFALTGECINKKSHLQVQLPDIL